MRLLDFQSDFYDICNEHSIKGSIVDNGDNIIMLAGLDAVPDNYNDILINQNNCNTLFYPKSFALIVNLDNTLESMHKFIDYAQKAELIQTLYNSVKLPIPERLRTEEVATLQFCNDNQWNSKHNVTYQTANAQIIDKFMRKERRNGIITRAWRNYTRSPRYDANASFLKRFFSFFKHNKNNVKLSILQKNTDTIKKITLSEEDYKEIKYSIKLQYPETIYSVSNKRTYISKSKCDIDTGDEKTSTKKGKTSYSERDIFIREEDEPIFSSLYNQIKYYNVDQTPLEKIECDKFSYIKVPHSYAQSFFNILKHYDIYFAIDNGKYTKNDLEGVNIIYNRSSENMIQNISRAIITSNSREHTISEFQKKASIDYSFSSETRTQNISR